MLFIAITAFALGFAASEYRSLRFTNAQNLISKAPVIQPDLPELSRAQPVTNVRQQPLATRVAVLDEKLNESFSWARVDQLIANTHYEEAIRLLQTQMGDAKNAARAWLVLASIYKKQVQPIAAVDAWFRYVKLEMNDQKINKSLSDIKDYLVQLKTTPALFNEDYSWLMAQFDELLKYNANDGELHLILAALLLQFNDDYQAQYHALMAANDPSVQKKAEVILAQLNGNNTPEEM
jgi:hypothetical protein